MLSSIIFYIAINYVINFTTAQSGPHSGNNNLFLGKYPIPRRTPGPIDIETNHVRNVVLPSLRLTSFLSENMRIINNGVAIEATMNQKTNTTLTGGPFGNNIYIYYKIRYYWSGNTTGPAATTINHKNGAPIEAVTFWYKKEYRSFRNALNYRDGLAILSTRIKVSSSRNTQFVNFQRKLAKVTKPGSSANIKHKDTFLWFHTFPKNTPYFSYPSSYTDQLTGRMYYCSTVCVFQPIISSISLRQFHGSFGLLKNSQGQPLTNSVNQYPAGNRPVVRSKGLYQNNH